MWLAMAMLACPCLAPPDLDERRAREDKFRPAAAAHAEALRADAVSEAKKLGARHPWAGEYDYSDDGSGAAPLTLAPNAGFTFESYGCGGLEDRNIGAVTEDGDRLRLHAAYTESVPREAEPPTEYVRIAWGARRYLVPPTELQAFCNAAHVGEEPFALRRRGGGATSGRPQTTAGPLECFLERPLWTRIAAVESSVVTRNIGDLEVRSTTVTLAGGRLQGFRKDMMLFLQATGEFVGRQLVVDAVADASAQATMTTVGTKGVLPTPSVGWPVSTRQDFQVR